MNAIKTFYGNVPGAPSPSNPRTPALTGRAETPVASRLPAAVPPALSATPRSNDGVLARLQIRRAFVDDRDPERAAELERIKQAIRDGRLVIRPERIADAMIKHSLEFFRNNQHA